MTHPSSSLPELGFGLGLRPKHYPHIFEHMPKVGWFEIISENFMDTDGRPRRNLERICEHYPVVMHGVALSIGTVDPLNSEYLKKLKALMNWVKPAWISDHLCWTGIAHRNTHDLLPVPYTEEALAHIVGRIRQVQDYLGCPIALENPSTYLEFKSSSMPEAEFIARMAQESGCQLLLDVNNIYVTCFNHRLDPKSYIDTLPLDRVIQIHLAGHDNKETHIIDTHDGPVIDDVWALYKYTLNKAGRTPNTMIEWDDHIPEFPVLHAELEKARAVAASAQDITPLPDFLAFRPLSILPEHLAKEQKRLQDAIVSGADKNPDTWIHEKENFSPKDQLDVYIKAYRYRLYDVTASDYPVLMYYLGAENFAKLVHAFIEATPSTHFNIGRYTATFPDFVCTTLPDDILAQDLCRLETALTQVADAEETPPLSPAALSGLTPETLMASKLHPRKALHLVKSLYPINRYYREVVEEKNPALPEKEKCFLAVFRHDDTLWRVEMEEAEYRLFSSLREGNTVESALAVINDTDAGNIHEWFARWMRFHLLTRIETGDTHVAA